MTFYYLLEDFYLFCSLFSEQLPLIFLAEGEDFKSGVAALVIILGAVGFGFILGRYSRVPDRDPSKTQIEKLLREIKNLIIKNGPPPVV